MLPTVQTSSPLTITTGEEHIILCKELNWICSLHLWPDYHWWCRPGFIWCRFSLHKCTSIIGLPGSRCKTSCWWFTLWTNHLITGWNTETPEVLFECYLYSLSRRMVPADTWHCHGFPSVSDGGKPCQGGCWRESPRIIPHPTTLLETFRGWHLYSQPPEQFPQPPQVHWVINWLHSWDGGSAEIALPWLADQTLSGWNLIDHSV